VIDFFEDAGISRRQGPRQAAGPRPAAEGRCPPRRRYGRGGVGRSLGALADRLLDFLRELHAKGVDLFLHQQGLDTSTPSGKILGVD
jgi:hypothetical protein